jgi:branched-chain amino acid transport system permease protein
VTDRFSTWLGIVFLVIVLVSPGGVVGLLESGVTWLRRHLPGARPPAVPSAPVTPVPLSTRSAL